MQKTRYWLRLVKYLIKEQSKFYYMSINHLPIIKVSPVDFKKALPVVNRSKRFIIPIPKLLDGGEPLIFPEGSEFAGKWIKNNNEFGIVFFNGKDSAWQAAKGNGQEAIVINDVTEEQSNHLHSKLLSLINTGDSLSLSAIKELMLFARNELAIVDFYNKQLASIHRDMTVIDSGNPYFVQVNNQKVHKALYVPDPFAFEGPVFQKFPRGAVLVNKGKFSWGVDAQVFLRSYRAIVGGRERKLGTLEEEFSQVGRSRQVF